MNPQDRELKNDLIIRKWELIRKKEQWLIDHPEDFMIAIQMQLMIDSYQKLQEELFK